jgi:hypothetical protein
VEVVALLWQENRAVIRKLFRCWLAVLALAALCQASLSGPVPTASAADQQTQTVALVIDYGDGVEKHFRGLPWREGMTVLELTQAAGKHPRGIAFEYRGRGATAFLFQIDDLKSQGGGRNWVYRLNGELADRSFAVQALQPSDRVVWEFAEYREK